MDDLHVFYNCRTVQFYHGTFPILPAAVRSIHSAACRTTLSFTMVIATNTTAPLLVLILITISIPTPIASALTAEIPGSTSKAFQTTMNNFQPHQGIKLSNNGNKHGYTRRTHILAWEWTICGTGTITICSIALWYSF